MGMKTRFIELWKRMGAQGNLNSEFDKLRDEYFETHRFYHNINHIRNCLADFDSAKHLTNRSDLVELAIWYHDIVYDTQAKDNEEKSGQLLYNICLTSKLPEELAKRAATLILATKHNLIPEDIDAKIIIDTDLAILGKQVQEFDEYEKNIRKEYSHVVEEQFKKKRSEILQRFLQRAENNSLYLTDFFRSKYGAQARINLQKSIEALR